MKKIISLLLAALMMINVCVCVNAEELSGNLEYVDSAYSPELDMYVIMAKDFTDNNNNKVHLYSSTDGVEWTECNIPKNLISTHFNFRKVRQNLVWWESQDVFAAFMAGKIYISENGIDWNPIPGFSYGNSNCVIDTDGDTIAIAAENKFTSIKDKDGNAEAIKTVGASGRYYKTILKYPGEEKYYLLDGSIYGGYASMVVDGEITKDKFIPLGFINEVNMDSVYIEPLKSWLVSLQKVSTISILNSDVATSPSSISTFKPMTDSGENKEPVTGIGVGENNAIFGTSSGTLYYTQISDMTNKSNVWKKVEPVSGIDYPTSEIRSISKSRDGYLLVVSDKGTYILRETDSGVEFVDTTRMTIKCKSERIETPQNGMEDVVISPIEINYWGQEVSGKIVSVKTPEDSDLNVSWNGSDFVFTVPDTAEGEREFIVTDKYNREHTITIMFAKEVDIDIEGYDIIALPEAGDPNVRIKYTPVIYASDGEIMDRSASITLVSAPKGVTFDTSTNTVIASSDSESGTLVLRATSDGKPENTKDFEFMVTKRLPSSIDVKTDRDNVMISETGDVRLSISAVVKDQVNNEMKKEKVKWSVEGNSEGLIIDEEAGVITVKTAARSGKKFITATSVTDSSVVGKKEVTFTWVDSRCVKEDLAAFDDNIVTGKNLPFVTVTENGTRMTWKTSDPSVITVNGVISRDRLVDKHAVVNVVASKNEEMDSKNINVTVLRADNIADIGDFEDETVDIENGTVTSEEVHQGEKSLKVNKSLSFDVRDLNEESMYVFEAYVKGTQGIRLITEKGKESVVSSGKNNWERIVVDTFYTKTGTNFTEKVNIVSGNEFYVDDIKVYDITPEYEVVAEAVAKAEYTESKTDVDNAQKILNDFYDVPSKKDLQDRLNKINTNSGGSNSGGGGNGSSGGSSSGKNPSVIPPIKNTPGAAIIGTGATENNQEVIEDYLLVFKDLKGHWAKDDIEAMADLDIVSGVSENSFNPEADITRAEFTKLIVKTMGLSETDYENTYYDIISDDWYAGYVQAAKNEGYITGYDGFFRPNDYITREEIAKIIVSAYYKKANKTLEQGAAVYFTDIPEISAWAYDYVAAASKEGFINGVTELKFAPKQRATRAQAVVMLKRLYDKLEA